MSCIYLGPRLGHLSHIFQHSPELVLNILFFTYSWNYVIYNKYNKLLLSFKTWYIPIRIDDYCLIIFPFWSDTCPLDSWYSSPSFSIGCLSIYHSWRRSPSFQNGVRPLVIEFRYRLIEISLWWLVGRYMTEEFRSLEIHIEFWFISRISMFECDL